MHLDVMAALAYSHDTLFRQGNRDCLSRANLIGHIFSPETPSPFLNGGEMRKGITVLFTIAPELANRTDAGFIRLTRSRPKLAGN